MAQGGTGRAIKVSFLLALGLWVMLALAMIGVKFGFPSGEDALDWPMIVCALVAAVYIAASWQFVPSVGWFVAGMVFWTVIVFLVLAFAPIGWLEFFFGPAGELPAEVTATLPAPAAPDGAQ